MGRLKRGGAETLVLSMLRHPPTDVEYQLFLLRSGGDLWSSAQELGVSIVPLRKGGRMVIPILALRLAILLRRARVDLLHAHMPRPGIAGRLGARLAGIPSCYTEHNLWQAYDAVTLAWHRRTLGLERRVFAVSQGVRESLLSARPDLGTRTEIVHNGLDVAAVQQHLAGRDAIRSSLGLGREGRLLINVANMRATKNQTLLLHAFAEIRRKEAGQMCLAIVGRDLGMKAELEALAASLGIERAVRFLGLREDALDLIAAADIFISSSDVEGLPMTLLEAGALGIPAVCTEAGGVSEVVEDGVTGRLVPPGDAERLSSAVLEVLRSSATAKRLGAALRERVEREFSLTSMMERYATAYAKMLS
jgi:glycosyltransferase involved in cell wall biosynthesis